MRLGVSYMAFDGEEFLEFSCRSIREHVEFISVVYQEVSYFGKKAPETLMPTLDKLKISGLIDELVPYVSDLSLHPRENEVVGRNLGRLASFSSGCTHHVTLDVDELFLGDEFARAKEIVEKENLDCSVVPLVDFFKKPTWQIVPDRGHVISFIHKAEIPYDTNARSAVRMDITRHPVNLGKYRVFHPEEILMRHMSYVRRDMRRKLENNSNWVRQDVERFMEDFTKYQLGGRLRIPPDFINRKTVITEDIFFIGDRWERHQSPE